MISGSFEEISQRLLFSTIFSLLIFGLFFFLYLIRVKINRLDFYATIQIAQRLLAFILSIFIWGIFTIPAGLVLWLLLFYILRNVVFRTNAKRLQELHYQFHSNKNGYPHIQNVSQWKQVFFIPKHDAKIDKQFKYHFSHHLDSSAPLLIFSLFELVTFSKNTPLYIFEFLIVATTGYVFLGRMVYHLSLNAPNSVFYLSPGLSYIPVIFVGIVYYTVTLIIMLSTMGHPIVVHGEEVSVLLSMT